MARWACVEMKSKRAKEGRPEAPPLRASRGGGPGRGRGPHGAVTVQDAARSSAEVASGCQAATSGLGSGGLCPGVSTGAHASERPPALRKLTVTAALEPAPAEHLRGRAAGRAVHGENARHRTLPWARWGPVGEAGTEAAGARAGAKPGRLLNPLCLRPSSVRPERGDGREAWPVVTCEQQGGRGGAGHVEGGARHVRGGAWHVGGGAG